MQIVFSGHGADPVHMLIDRYVGQLKDMYPVQNSGESAQAFKKREEYGKGIREGFSLAFEVVIANARISRYGARMGEIPSPAGFEIAYEFLPAIEEGWRTAGGKKGTDAQAFWEALEPHLEEYMFPPDLEKAYDELRRQAVLKGEEAPDPSDKDWLNEEAEALERRAADIRSRFDIS